MRDDDGERDEKAKLVRAIDEKARLVRAIIWLFLLVSSIGILAVNYMGYSLPDYVFGAAAVFSITGILAAVFVLFEKFIVWFVASRVRAIILLFVIMSSIGILAANLTGALWSTSNKALYRNVEYRTVEIISLATVEGTGHSCIAGLVPSLKRKPPKGLHPPAGLFFAAGGL